MKRKIRIKPDNYYFYPSWLKSKNGRPSSNISIVTFGNNASAMIISYEYNYRNGNAPIDILGRNRNDYQDLGLFPAEHHFTLYLQNESQYRNLLQELYKHEEIEFGYNETSRYYGVPTHIHKHPIEAGRIEDLYIVDVDITSTDPLCYGQKFKVTTNLDNQTGSFYILPVLGDTKIPIDLHFDVYDMNKTTVTGSDSGSSLSFGRADQLGFDHLYMHYVAIPRWRDFWDNYNWHYNYILPPLNLTSGNISCGNKMVKWDWGIYSSQHSLNHPDIIQCLWLKDDYYFDFPMTDSTYTYIPCTCPCDINLLTERLTAAKGAIFVDLKNDTNIDEIQILGDVKVPIVFCPRDDWTDGINIFIWNNINNSWDPLLTRNLNTRTTDTGKKHIDISINYSNNWNTSGGLMLLFYNQKTGIKYDDPNSCPQGWDLLIDAQRHTKNTTRAYCSTGTNYLRIRVFRKNHRIATIIPRYYEITQYGIIKGINNIPNNTVQIHIVNAASDAIGDYIYRTIEIPSNNWSGEHLIPLASINYLPNASYIGILLQLKQELLNATILPAVELYNMPSTTTLEICGGEVEVNTRIYGKQKESAQYVSNTHVGKSIFKEYSQIETLKVIEIHDELEPLRITRLQGQWIQGHYELNSKVSDKFIFNPFENIYDSYYEKSGGINISSSLVNLESGYITYLISPNYPIIDVPTLYLNGNVSKIYVSGENESFYEINYINNHTGYIGSSEIDLRGYERFFLKLEGGSFSGLHVSCDLGSMYNPLPWAIPNGPTTYYYSKDININTTLTLKYRAAYYT